MVHRTGSEDTLFIEECIFSDPGVIEGFKDVHHIGGGFRSEKVEKIKKTCEKRLKNFFPAKNKHFRG